jgi:glycosyltransferase involved in cell wall biosynthesis
MDKKIAVIIPAYNEESTIKNVIEDFSLALPNASVVVVDNNSSDSTNLIAKETLKKNGDKGLLLFESRRGKANAIRKAFVEVNADVYVLVDADCTYSSLDLEKLLKPVLNGEADIVVGDRLSNGDYKSENKRLFHNFGNNLIINIINSMFHIGLKDIMSGYRVFSRNFVKNYPILVKGFELETDMTLYAIQNKFTILEIPVNYKDRPKGSKSKLNTFSDGFSVLHRIFSIFKNYKPFMFFSLCSLLFLVLGLLSGVPVILEFIETKYVTHVPLAILAVSFVILAFLSFFVGLILDTIVHMFCEMREIIYMHSKIEK